MKKAVAFLGGALALGLTSVAWAGPTAVGPAFHISSCATCHQEAPKAAGATSGSFLTVWEGATPTDAFTVSGRFYGTTGAPAAVDFLPSKNTAADQYDAAVTTDKTGNFIVVWTEVANGNSEIMAQRFRANRTRIGNALRVSQDAVGTPTIPADFNPAVAGTADGGFVVVWMNLLPKSSTFPGTTPQVLARRFNSTGAAITAPVKISTGLVSGDRPSVCVDTAGQTVAVWTSVDGFPLFEPNHKGVSLRRLTPAGALMGTAETVVAPPKAGSAMPSVSCGKAGTFVVVWHTDQAPAVDRNDIVGQRFTRLARPAGAAFRINTATPSEQKNPAVAFDPQGNFVVVWQISTIDTVGIHGRRFAASGAALSPEFNVISGPPNSATPSVPDLGILGITGKFLVVWQAGSQGIFGRIYTPN